jgi:hypothetical protein
MSIDGSLRMTSLGTVSWSLTEFIAYMFVRGCLNLPLYMESGVICHAADNLSDSFSISLHRDIPGSVLPHVYACKLLEFIQTRSCGNALSGVSAQIWLHNLQ